jgi:pimeloyl-ACP methyl ester carboxylesterase
LLQKFTGVVGMAALVGCGAEPAIRLHWQPCGVDAECTTIVVPLNWDEPAGKQIVLAVARHRASDVDKRIGTLFFFNGQGASAMDFVASSAVSGLMPSQLVERFDIVGVDPRGGGVNPGGTVLGLPFESTPLLCDGRAYASQLGYFPENRGEYERLVAHNRSFASTCGDLVGQTGAPSHARDIEAVRRALGDEQVSWISWTTGNLVALTYASLYPERVRAMVLDQPFDATVPFLEFVQDHAVAVQDEFNRFVALCTRTEACPFHGADARAAFAQLIGQADTTPVVATGPTPPPEDEGAPIEHPFPGDDLLFLTEQLLEIGEVEAAPGFTGFDAIGFGVVEAMSGSTSVFPGAYMYSIGWPGFWNRYRVHSCTDFRSPIQSYEELHGVMEQMRGVAPDMRGISQAWDILIGCTGWPAEHIEMRPAESFSSSLPPVLVVSSRHSAYAPFAHAERIASRLPNATVLPYEGDTHIVMLASECATQWVADYLTSGRVPPEGTSCL